MKDDSAFRSLFSEELVPTDLPGAYTSLRLPQDREFRDGLAKFGFRLGKPIMPAMEPAPAPPRSRANARRSATARAVSPGVAAGQNSWTSPGWSGCTVSGAWSQAFARWRVPIIGMPYKESPGQDGYWWTYSWVGLDGAGTNELLQVGIAQAAHPDGRTWCMAWYEWVAPGSLDDPPYVSFTRIHNFGVSPGNRISAAVKYLPDANGQNSAGYLLLSNEETDTLFQIVLRPPPQVTMPGATLDWIVEDPGGGYPNFVLAGFSPVHFELAAGISRDNQSVGYPAEGDRWNIVNTAGTTVTNVSTPDVGSKDYTATVGYYEWA
jgi:hypothetical protein